MASIPLVALSVHPQEAPDLVGNYARLQALKAQAQQMQIQGQQAPLQQQLLRQQVQTGQQDMAARQALNQAYAGAVTKDANGVPTFDQNKLAQNLANGPAAYKTPEVLKGINDFHTGLIKMQTDMADLQTKSSDILGSAAYAVKAANYDPMLAHSLLDTLPPSPQILQMRSQIDNPQALKQLVDTAIQNSPKQQAFGQEQSKNDQQAANQDAMRAQAAANFQQTQLNENRAAQQRQRQIDIEGGRLKLEQQKAAIGLGDNLTGPDFLNTLPAGMQAQVKAAANGDIAIPPPGTRSPQAQAIRNAVLTYDPTYTDARYKGKQNFKTSGDANSIMQLATAAQHVEDAQNNSQKVGFAPLLHMNATPSDAAYNQDVKFFSGEAGKLVKNGVITEGELKDLQNGMNSTRQSIRDAALAETVNLVGGKVNALFQKYKNATGQDLPINQFFDAPTQQRLSRFGVTNGTAGQSGAQQAPAAQGNPQTHVFSASAWKAANPQGDVNAAIAAAKQQNYQVTQ